MKRDCSDGKPSAWDWRGSLRSKGKEGKPAFCTDQYTANGLLDAVPAYDSTPCRRTKCWRFTRLSAYVHQTPPGAELTAIRRSNQRGLPYGDPCWVKRLAKRLHLDLTIRPRGRSRKTAASKREEIK